LVVPIAIGLGILAGCSGDEPVPTPLDRPLLALLTSGEFGEGDGGPPRRAFALGSCFYVGDLARIDLDGGWQWRRGISRGGRPTMCGERMAASRGLVVFTEGPERDGGHESEITVLDADTGSVRARLPIRAPAVDLVLVG
jgi:hypothetical protein